MNRRFTAVLLAAIFSLLLALYAAPVFAANASDWTVPAGYNANDYTKVRTFLELTDSSGEANWLKIASHEDYFSLDDPTTWSFDSYDEGLPYGFFWKRASSNSEYRLSGIEIYGFGMAGSLDLSGCSALGSIEISDNPITALNLEGCTGLMSLDAKNCLLRSINWVAPQYSISITVVSDGSGYVGVRTETKHTPGADAYRYDHHVFAVPEEGMSFVGWFDNSGNCVSVDADYIYFTTNGSEPTSACPSTTLNLTARFVKEGEEPADPTEPVDPTEPATPTEPAEPTEPASPTEPTEPSDPGVPSTGAFSLVCIGAVTAISGISLIVLRKK